MYATTDCSSNQNCSPVSSRGLSEPRRKVGSTHAWVYPWPLQTSEWLFQPKNETSSFPRETGSDIFALVMHSESRKSLQGLPAASECFITYKNVTFSFCSETKFPCFLDAERTLLNPAEMTDVCIGFCGLQKILQWAQVGLCLDLQSKIWL